MPRLLTKSTTPRKLSAACAPVSESAIHMARAALSNVGLSQESINRAEDQFRTRDTERLAAQIEGGDVRMAQDRILTSALQSGANAEPG